MSMAEEAQAERNGPFHEIRRDDAGAAFVLQSKGNLPN